MGQASNGVTKMQTQNQSRSKLVMYRLPAAFQILQTLTSLFQAESGQKQVGGNDGGIKIAKCESKRMCCWIRALMRTALPLAELQA